jgi:hypothetical protein
LVQTILPPSVQINASAPQYLQRPSTSRPNSERKKRLMALAIGQPSFLTNLGYGVAETAKLCNLYFGILLAPSNDIIIKFYNLFNTYFQFIFQSSQINKIHIVPISGQKKLVASHKEKPPTLKVVHWNIYVFHVSLVRNPVKMDHLFFYQDFIQFLYP